MKHKVDSENNLDQEIYEGLLIAVLLASTKKVKAGLRYCGTIDFQDYPPGIIEVGAALDAIDMVAADILNYITVNDHKKTECRAEFVDRQVHKFDSWGILAAKLAEKNKELKRNLSDSSAEIVLCHTEIESLTQENAELLLALGLLVGEDGDLFSDEAHSKAREAIRKAKEK